MVERLISVTPLPRPPTAPSLSSGLAPAPPPRVRYHVELMTR